MNLHVKIKAILFLIPFLFTKSTFAQNKKAKIKDYLNKEIMIEDNFSGQSITLIKENNGYVILRKFFGSGVNLAGESKYVAVFDSEYQLTFSDLVETSLSKSMNDKKEYFLLNVEETGICLYLNKLKVFTHERKLLQTDATKEKIIKRN